MKEVSNMQIKFSSLTPILLFALVNITTLPTTVKAQDSNVECKKAVANAKNRLQKVPNVLVEQVWTRNNKENYSDFPQGRPIEYIFYLTGSKHNGRMIEVGIKKVENSPQFLKFISQDIINKCNSVSSVSFGNVLSPGCGRIFGLMPDGTVNEFQDVDVSSGRQLKWGESFCN
jgi:hypothetical protein